jgi:catechol 2,3-dioxygenase-like lactoylglutathione lyase family enzyme
MELIHTCYRITHPERSITFYEALGLELQAQRGSLSATASCSVSRRPRT